MWSEMVALNFAEESIQRVIRWKTVPGVNDTVLGQKLYL